MFPLAKQIWTGKISRHHYEHFPELERSKKVQRRFAKRLKEFAKGYLNAHCDVKRLAKRAIKYRRKISGCHRTPEGAGNRDVIMSVMGTMRLQGEEFFEAGREYVVNSLT